MQIFSESPTPRSSWIDGYGVNTFLIACTVSFNPHAHIYAHTEFLCQFMIAELRNNFFQLVFADVIAITCTLPKGYIEMGVTESRPLVETILYGT